MNHDDPLVARAVAGDLEARNEIVEKLLPFFWGKAWKVAGKFPGLLAEDLVQVGVARVLETFPLFDPSLGFKPITYFGVVFQDAVRRHVEKEKGTPPTTSLDMKMSGGESVLVMFPIDDDVQEEIARRENAGKVREAVDRLPERFRAVVERRMRGESLQEIAEALGTTREKARLLEAAALRMLRIYLWAERR